MAGSIRWLSHAFFLISTPGGKTIIIDPWIEGNPLCPITLDDVKAADLVLVSHDHFDHVANAVDIAKKTGATVVTLPETAGRLSSELGLPGENIVNFGHGMNIGATVEIKGIKVTMTQAYHSSQTASLCGYIIRLEDGKTIYHAGDTGIFATMRLLGEMYNIDVALLPIGSVFVMDPFQAAWALKLINPKVAIPMHYRTFPMLLQDAKPFVELAQREAPQVKVVVLEPGQEYALE